MGISRLGHDEDLVVSRLLLTDNGVESDVYRWFFQAKELDMVVVKDATAGLRQAQADPPDTLVVSSSFGLDYIAQVARTLKSDPSTEQVRLIALLDSGDSVEGVGADAVVIRPFRLEYLYQVIKVPPNLAPS